MPDHKIKTRGQRPGRQSLVITPEVEHRIIQFLDFEKLNKVHRKQRFTASYIYKKLKEENLYNGSSRSIRAIVSKIRHERKQIQQKSFLNLDFALGNFLQVDHGPVEVEIAGTRINGNLFCSSVPGACLRYCQFYPTKASEAWGEFHERSFNFFGGTFPKIIYDNDSVLKINQTGEQTGFCIELQINYKFEAIFCNKASGWEKGAVESSVGYCRRNFLAGLPQFNSINEINDYLTNKSLETILGEKHYVSERPLCEIFDELKPKLSPFDPGKGWGSWVDLKVNNFQHIHFQGYNYSVPERFVGSLVRVFVSVSKIEIYSGDELVFSHQRNFFGDNDSLILEHYLDQLLKKPRAIAHAKVMHNHQFPEHILELKRRFESKYPEKEAGIELIKTLMLQRKSSPDDFKTAILLALEYHSINSSAIESILAQLQIEQIRSIDYEHSINIDNHFGLEKYSQLEKTEEINHDIEVTY